MPAQSIKGNRNVQVLVKDSPYTRVEISGKTVAELWLPKFRQPVDPHRNKDLDLLLAKYAITDLAGREALWKDCLAWCERPEPVSIRCITGRGGSGKTRFGLELAHHLRGCPDWEAWFVRFSVPEPFDLWAETHGSKNALLVFDYAGDIATPLAESLRRLADNPPHDPQRRLRVLLLARTGSWEEGWLASLKPRSTIEEPIASLFDPREPIPLEALDQSDRVKVFGQALKKAAEFANLPEPPAPDPVLFTQKRAEETLRDPLALIMAAVIGVRTGIPQALTLTRLELAHEVADELVGRRLEAAFPENPQLACHMAAYVTLCGGLSKPEARDALAVEARENNLGAVDNPGTFIDRLQGWFPGEKTDIGPIEPDIVGEAFLLGRRSPRLVHAENTILRAAALRAQPVVQALIRMTQDVSLAEKDAREEPLRWLRRLIDKGEADDFSLLLAIESALPVSTVVLRPHAEHVTQLVLKRLKVLATLSAAGGETDSALLSETARILNNLANRQSAVGLRPEALATAQEAVVLRRELVARNRDAFLPDLAMSLNNLANMQSEVGLRPEALATAQEAVARYRELVARNRDAFLPNLSASLNNLATWQSAVGLRSEALATAQEAVALRRELVARNRDAFLPDLAMSLNNLAGRQSEVGLRPEALATAQEAVALRRELVARNRDAFLPDLAGSLNNLATMQSALGLRSEALATAQEAVALRRELVARNRDAFLPDLAGFLNNLANRQSEVGLRPEALATVQEAVALRRELVARNRDAFLPDLAMSLNNLAIMQGEVGLRPEALATVQEAVTLYRELVARNRGAFVPDLAMSLNNLATMQGAVGLRPEALATVQEAVALRRELVARNRDAFLPNLAMSLNNLATMQSAVGLRPEALATAQEAVARYRELEARNRDAFAVDLARSQGTLGQALAALERFPEAAEAFAVGLRTVLPHSEQYPQALAGLVGTLLGGYAAALQNAKLDFDPELVGEAMRVLGPHLKQRRNPYD